MNGCSTPFVNSSIQVVVDVFTIGCLYLVLLCAFASGIIFIIGTEKFSQSLNMTYASLGKDAADFDPIQMYSGTDYKVLFLVWLVDG